MLCIKNISFYFFLYETSCPGAPAYRTGRFVAQISRTSFCHERPKAQRKHEVRNISDLSIFKKKHRLEEPMSCYFIGN